MRVGELTCSDHTLKARNIHIALNKQKIMVVLYTSKTHGKHTHQQTIKIVSNTVEDEQQRALVHTARRCFCSFQLLCDYLLVRGDFDEDNDPFFIC